MLILNVLFKCKYRSLKFWETETFKLANPFEEPQKVLTNIYMKKGTFCNFSVLCMEDCVWKAILKNNYIFKKKFEKPSTLVFPELTELFHCFRVNSFLHFYLKLWTLRWYCLWQVSKIENSFAIVFNCCRIAFNKPVSYMLDKNMWDDIWVY